MRFVITMVAILLSNFSSAQSVVPDTVEFAGGPNGGASIGDYSLTVRQDSSVEFFDFTSAWFNYEWDPSTSIGAVQFTNVNIDEGSDWYLVREGDLFTADTVSRDEYPELVSFGPVLGEAALVGPSYWSNWPFPDFEPLPLPNFATTFYLGFATAESGNYQDRTIYGWVHLRTVPSDQSFIPASLELIGSATAFESAGIVIGTLQGVPETTSAIGVLSAVLVFLVSRRTVAANF